MKTCSSAFRLALLTPCLLMGACSGGSKNDRDKGAGGPGSSSAAAGPASPSGLTGDCRADAAAVGAYLASTPHDLSLFMAVPEVVLVKRRDVPAGPIPYAPVVVASAKTLLVEGSSLDEASLAEHLSARRAQDSEKATPSPRPDRIYLQLDAATPWSRVVAIVAAAAGAGYTEPAFLFDTEATLTPPPRTAIDAELDALEHASDSGGGATKVAELAQRVATPCPALITLFGSVASATGDRAQHLIDGIAPALIDCNCKADPATVRSLMWRVVAAPPRVQVIAFETSARHPRLELPATMPWAEASQRIKLGTAGLQLVAR